MPMTFMPVSQNPFFFIILVAVASGAWPLIVRFTSLNAQWVAITVTLATAIVAGVFSYISSPALPPVRPLVIGLVAGTVNAVGMIAWGRLITLKGVELSKVLPIAFVLMPVVSVIGAFLIFKEPMTLKKIIGVVAAGISIYLLQ